MKGIRPDGTAVHLDRRGPARPPPRVLDRADLVAERGSLVFLMRRAGRPMPEIAQILDRSERTCRRWLRSRRRRLSAAAGA
jgi:DNA-directed RNA polymerase specialized sigma24 family protein